MICTSPRSPTAAQVTTTLRWRKGAKFLSLCPQNLNLSLCSVCVFAHVCAPGRLVDDDDGETHERTSQPQCSQPPASQPKPGCQQGWTVEPLYVALLSGLMFYLCFAVYEISSNREKARSSAIPTPRFFGSFFLLFFFTSPKTGEQSANFGRWKTGGFGKLLDEGISGKFFAINQRALVCREGFRRVGCSLTQPESVLPKVVNLWQVVWW